MPLSCAERTKRYREKLKEKRPEEYERQKKQNLAKVKSKKKKVSELTPEEAEIRREKWREEKRKSRKRPKKDKIQNSSQDSVPGIPGTSSATQKKDSDSNLKNEKYIQMLQRRNKVLVNKCRRNTKMFIKLKNSTETHRKRLKRLNLKKNKEIEDLNLQLLKMKAREEILENTLKKTYQSCSSRKEKQSLKKLVMNSKNKKMISKMMGLKNKVKPKKKKLRPTEITEITNFYTRDDISRNTAGKKEVRTKNKKKEQIRYLLDTLVNTYRKYKAEGGRYGFTTFYKHKPFFVLSPGMSSRSTCLCIKHSNFGFLHTAMVKNNLVTGSTQDILSQVSCDINNYECMWSKCDECRDKKLQYHQSGDENLNQQVEWSRWERQDHTYHKKDGETIKEIKTKKTAKVTKKGTLNDLIRNYEKELLLFKKHYFNMKYQQSQYQKVVSGLKDNEVLIVCDFSENYQAKLAEEIQSMHFGASNLQICLHTGMVFWKNRSQSFCTLSDNTSHQPPAIWAHLMPILDMVKKESPETTIIHFYSDGPSSQYRQKNNFYLLAYYTKEYMLDYCTWSFYEAGHGKNVADGIGGSVKRTLDRRVCSGNDIVDAKDAYNLLNQCLKITKVYIIESAEIEQVAIILPAKIPILKGTMQLHQLTTSQNGQWNIIHYRDVGCFCGDQRGQCICFSPKSHAVTVSLPNVRDLPKRQSTTSSKTETNGNPAVVTDPHSLSQDLKNLTNIEDSFDLDTLEDWESIFGEVLTDSTSQVISIENTVGSAVNGTENCLLGNADTTYKSADIVGVENTQSFNILKDKEVSTQKRTQWPDGFYVDPKKKIIMSQEQPINPSTPTKDHTKKGSITIIEDVTIPVPSNSQNGLPGKCSAVKNQVKRITEKPKTEKDKNNKLGCLECKNCLSFLLGKKTKCISCQNWFCSECVGGPIISDYICDACLKDSQELLFL